MINKIFTTIFLIGLITNSHSNSCHKEEDSKAHTIDDQTKSHIKDAKKIIPENLPDESIFHLGSKWTNDQKKKVSLGNYNSKPSLVAMVYTSCEYACPMIIHNIHKVESKLTEAEKEKIQFVLISIDPERDTPEKLNQYRGKMKLDPRWKLLTGDSDDVLELAAILGVKYKKNKDGGFSHSNMLTLLSEKGKVMYQSKGLNDDPNWMKEEIQKIIKN